VERIKIDLTSKEAAFNLLWKFRHVSNTPRRNIISFASPTACARSTSANFNSWPPRVWPAREAGWLAGPTEQMAPLHQKKKRFPRIAFTIPPPNRKHSQWTVRKKSKRREGGLVGEQARQKRYCVYHSFFLALAPPLEKSFEIFSPSLVFLL
jgi:hypothetical protein